MLLLSVASMLAPFAALFALTPAERGRLIGIAIAGIILVIIGWVLLRYSKRNDRK